ncbi:phosphonate ABC transporter, inner membrane subunit [Caldalkalibacillus thermarum TA2.A1]|uniref:Phosphonate ABC transporter, inner membrane subunit n=2 Tax=Caldalkalibacillus thermarum (strain TA2.A1) TaxID=986075 RepID=F5LAG9_CALTT|nr:phosphonate ABC transporter, permease protein PhnE [Caldalkalibacillus thermarum]EGL81718.1 phosphonate ABC transporter, inner membrane subunit [Caldalkalibacillus thermarum TA2.A1]
MSLNPEPLKLHKPNRSSYWLKFFGITALMVILYWIALTQTNLSYNTNVSAATTLKRLVVGPFTHEQAIARIPEFSLAMLETVAIAYAGTLIGAILAIPMGFLAAKNISNRLAYIGKGILNGIRAFPELLFAIIFVAAVGMGPYAGVLAIGINSIGMLGKLYSEVVESIDMSVLEALKASGANRLQMIWFGVIPQIIPEFSSYAIYRFEIDVRSASILGLVGAGGIGAPLLIAAQQRSWEQVGMMLLIIIVVVTLIDYLSAYIRRKIV